LSKLPAIQFYPGDWRKDVGVQSLNFHDRGVWFEILMLMHESEVRGKLMLGGKCMPDEILSNVLRIDKNELVRTIQTLIERGVTEREKRTGALINRRMLRDEILHAENRKRLNDWRKSKKTQGNGNSAETKMKRLPSSSSSSSSSSSTSVSKVKGEEPHISKAEISDTDTDPGSELMAANWLLEELGVVADNGTRRVAGDAIRLLAKEGGTIQTASEYILEAGKNAVAAGEVINRFWFTDQRYRPAAPKKSRRALEREAREAEFMKGDDDDEA